MTAEYTPQGNIGKYSDEWIEASLDWTGRKGFLVQCLIDAGWLDYEGLTIGDPLPTDSEWAGNRKVFVHDWHDHADSAVTKRLQRLGLQFLKFAPKVTGQSSVTDWTTAASRARVALPTPSLALPVRTPHDTAAGSDFPESARAVRKYFPSADDSIVVTIAHEAVRSYVDVVNGHGKSPPLTDALIAEAIEEAHFEKQKSAGAFVQKVARVVKTWAEEALRDGSIH